VLIKIGLYVCVKLSVIQNHKGSNWLVLWTVRSCFIMCKNEHQLWLNQAWPG
jgi:hypothetical protein